MAARLQGKRIALLASEGFDQYELDATLRALIAERGSVDIVAPRGDRTIRGFASNGVAHPYLVDRVLGVARADEYDGLVVSGGAESQERLLRDPATLGFVEYFMRAGRPVAAMAGTRGSLLDAVRVEGAAPIVSGRDNEDLEGFLRATIRSMQDHPPHPTDHPNRRARA